MAQEPSLAGDDESFQNFSLRSRASSTISTGTKTSIGTFANLNYPQSPSASVRQALNMINPPPPMEQQTTNGNFIDVLLGRRNFRIAARPGSILSISSYDQPAPPYSEAITKPAHHPPVTFPAPDGCTPQHTAPRSEPAALETNLSAPASSIEQGQPDIVSPTPRPAAVLRSSTADAIGHDLSGQASFPLSPLSPTGQNLFPNPEDHHDEATERQSPPSLPPSPHETSANAISAHYTSVVRAIDSNHRNELARLERDIARLESEHESKLAAARNDIDAAHRDLRRREQRGHAEEIERIKAESESSASSQRAATVLAVADLKTQFESEKALLQREIERLKTVVEDTERSVEDRLRSERNAIEDVWERRWKDRMRLAAEEVGKSQAQARAYEEEVARRWGAGKGEDVRRVVLEKFKGEEDKRRRADT